MTPRSAVILATVICTAAALGAPFLVYPVFLMLGLVMALFAAAFNLVFGYAGLLSFGHAAFFGVGAYVTAFLMKNLDVGAGSAIAASILASAVLGAVMGILAIRRRGIYFAMVTLALAELVYFLALRWPATGGENGLQGVPRGSLLGFIDLSATLNLYFVVLTIVAAALFFLYRVINSPFGMVLRGFRDDEKRMVSLGYSVHRHLLLALTLSAALAGLAGSLKAIVFQFAALPDISWHLSGHVVLACLIGGVGTFAGPIIGGIVLALLQSMLAESGEWATLILGVVLIVCVHLFREGVVGSLRLVFSQPQLSWRKDSNPTPIGEPIKRAGGGN